MTSLPLALGQTGLFCPVCLNGNLATGNQNIGGIPCQLADQLGRNRNLTDAECASYQALAATPDDPCECADPTPKPTMMVTSKPTVAPTTASPTAAPTLTPTRTPTPVPTSVPTVTPTVDAPFCNICRDSPILNPNINNPDAVIANLDDQMSITCQEAQDMAIQKNGRPGFTTSQCLDFQALAVGRCGCPFEPTPTPAVSPTTPVPNTDAAPPTITNCPVCQNGNPISIPSGQILSITCTEWNIRGTNGDLTLEECVAVQLLASTELDPCGCRPVTPSPTTTAPTSAVPVPTATPTVPPTRIADRVEFCNICRDAGLDLSLSEPTATLASFVSGGISISCQFAQILGSVLNPDGPVYTLEQCAIAQSLAVGTCGCPGEVTAPPAPSSATVPTAAPLTDEGIFCLICPDGNMATGLGILGSMQCQDVDAMGRNKMLTSEECLAAQTRAAQDDDPCGCGPTPGTFNGR